MALLDHNLATIDGEGMPAYLESTNPANVARYESRGFRRVGEFIRPGEGLPVARMWRPENVQPSLSLTIPPITPR